MRARQPAFWSRAESPAARLLAPVGAVLGAVTLHRMRQGGGAIAAPVICVGNPTVGGAGKTPTALRLIALLTARGARPAAILRGHGGKQRGVLRVDPAQHDAALVGDEALLLAAAAPTIVCGGDRLGGARLAVAQGASHVVMDDGFQNPGLMKDASVLVVDGAAGVGNGRILPAGPLRAALAPQLALCDLLLMIGAGEKGEAVAAAARALGVPVAQGALVPDAEAVTRLRGRRLLAFAGIGRPEKVFATLRAAGLDVAATRSFGDHHAYTPADIAALVQEAAEKRLTLVTTTKDLARLGGPEFAPLRGAIATLPVTLEGADAALLELIATAERRHTARAA